MRVNAVSKNTRRAADRTRLIDILERGPSASLWEVAVYLICTLVGSVCVLVALGITILFLLALEPPQ